MLQASLVYEGTLPVVYGGILPLLYEGKSPLLYEVITTKAPNTQQFVLSCEQNSMPWL